MVFESDDWGMIRMSSAETYNRFLKKGYPVDQCVYNKFDALESNEDVEALSNVLVSVKDKKGNHPCFTINNIVANPDFKKIKESGFKRYYCESFTETHKRYEGSDRVKDLFEEGKKKGIFNIQFHGREHVNVNRWIEELRNGNPFLLDAFEEKMFSVAFGDNLSGRASFLDSFGYGYTHEIENYNSIIKNGISIFKEIWGISPVSFIAPCYIWNDEIQTSLYENGIRYIQGTHVQKSPQHNFEEPINYSFRYTGRKKYFDTYSLVRNCFFEPSAHPNENNVDNCLNQIRNAFFWNKPAIICSHRVNYSGRISNENRENNLIELNILLKKIIKKYPNVEFLSTKELGDLISK